MSTNPFATSIVAGKLPMIKPERILENCLSGWRNWECSNMKIFLSRQRFTTISILVCWKQETLTCLLKPDITRSHLVIPRTKGFLVNWLKSIQVVSINENALVTGKLTRWMGSKEKETTHCWHWRNGKHVMKWSERLRESPPILSIKHRPP